MSLKVKTEKKSMQLFSTLFVHPNSVLPLPINSFPLIHQVEQIHFQDPAWGEGKYQK